MKDGLPPQAWEILRERFGHDVLISLATAAQGIPSVRTMNAYYENGCFYAITHAQSAKMRQIAQNPIVAIAGDWFTAHGVAESLGWFGAERNRGIALTLQAAFQQWIDNGHSDLQDENTVILRVRLTDGVLFSHGTRYDLAF